MVEKREKTHLSVKTIMGCPHLVNMNGPSVLYRHSNPETTGTDQKDKGASTCKSRDRLFKSDLARSFSQESNLGPHPLRTASSRPPSPLESLGPARRSVSSSLTTTTVSVNLCSDFKFQDSRSSTKCSSLLSRFCSSTSVPGAARPPFHLSDFRRSPEQPEKHFIDSIGMVIPGACDRTQCEDSRAHLVSHWPLCEPIEYSTNLADHAITHQDYTLLLNALANFLSGLPRESRTQRHTAPWWHIPQRKCPNNACGSGEVDWRMAPPDRAPAMDSKTIDQVFKHHVQELNNLLNEITGAWQKRNIPVMLCISSYSLLGSNCVSKSHVQVLHVQLEQTALPDIPKDLWATTQLDISDPVIRIDSGRFNVARHLPNNRRRSLSPRFGLMAGPHHGGNQHLHFRDYTQPWPLWPNAIPSQKREQTSANADRYGLDPYFRAWMRANIKSRTTCMSYAKYMIETENDPFVNKRLEYVTSPQQQSPMLKRLGICAREKSIGLINRKSYEHNRRLECRKATENGGRRLRVLRFGLRQAIYPPHTPEMTGLGLTRDTYDEILTKIETIRNNTRPNYFECVHFFFKSWYKIRRRTANNSCKEVYDYLRDLNASDRRIVWTVEKLPGVHDPESRRDSDEWEISAWNGEDPLDLVIELEKWGLVEKKLSIGDDE